MADSVVAALNATMQMSLELRRGGEAELARMATVPGFAAMLVQVACAEGHVAPELRQLAAVILKNHVRVHWCEEAEAFAPPCICDEEKAAVRAALPAGLRDSSAGIRTAVSAAVACIATWDWPDLWPELMDCLLRPLEEAAHASHGVASSDADADATFGSLRCLELCASDLGEAHLGGALQRLLPLLLALYARTEPAAARFRALAAAVARRLLERVAALCTDHELLRALETQLLPVWADTVLATLTAPAATDGADGDGGDGAAASHALPIASLRFLELLVSQFPKSLNAQVRIWPLYNIAVPNSVWCIAYTKRVAGGPYLAQKSYYRACTHSGSTPSICRLLGMRCMLYRAPVRQDASCSRWLVYSLPQITNGKVAEPGVEPTASWVKARGPNH